MDRVTDVTKTCFDALIQIRQCDQASLPPPEMLRHRLRGCVEEMQRRAGDAGFSQQDTQDMAYALVALMDEVVLAKPDPHRQYWMGNLLQMHFFSVNVAGEEFFARLKELREDPHRQEVLRVYYLCLVLGFQGRYRIRGGDLELMSLTESVQKELARGRRRDAEVLSPHGERPQESRVQMQRTAPLLVVSAGAVLFSLLIFGILYGLLRSRVTDAVQDMSASVRVAADERSGQ